MGILSKLSILARPRGAALPIIERYSIIYRTEETSEGSQFHKLLNLSWAIF
jgi:hypothetical protein